MAISVCLLLFASSGSSTAIEWQRMIMPGPLVKAHAHLEKDCASCHQAFEVDLQRSLCLVCHERVAADLKTGKGFHARHPLAASGQCMSCHPDHKGREADVRGLSDATFDHAKTDYPLRGRHETVTCNQCHLPDKARRDAPTDCVDCHRGDDIHKGALSTNCSQCHGESSWQSTKFDHAKTRYPLTGAHGKASCSGCHVAQRYEGTPQDCVSCHAIDDTHGGKFGSKCADCHDTRAWKKQGFDHAKKSGFALEGAHAKASCATCHRKPPGERKLPETCAGCHSRDDIHAGRFGDQCSTCHTPSTWRSTRFDHAKQAKFPLQGAHAKASCNSCHSQAVKQGELAKDCHGCHRVDDVHRGNLGRECADCHDQQSFSDRVRFDHELTDFPLLGLHAMGSCESCHRDHSFEKNDISCQSCHTTDDVHRGSLGTKCESCHNPNGWALWRFDHNSETEFALHGAHEGLECTACHQTPMKSGSLKPADCIDCHRSQDAHRGEFGKNCDTCHSSAAWKPATFGRVSGNGEEASQ
jgi:hypothetical protein